MRTVATDCRHFLGDRPCIWHKREGAICECVHYAPIEERILVIKLDAIGDVLRTTSLLPALAKAHPDAAIAWITRANAAPLLSGNPHLTEVIPYGPDAIVHLQTRSFDTVINLDAGKLSAGMASAAKAAKRVGFVLDELGHVVPTNAAASEWFRMGLFDDLKRENRRTYQELMCAILDLPTEDLGYVLALSGEEIEAAREELRALGLRWKRPVVGLHTGGGERWRLKQWREEGFVELIERLTAAGDAEVVLFGGPSERARNERIRERAAGRIFDTGCDNPMRHFAALLSHCDVVLTGDSLAMHVALATDRRVVVLFGPTSASEIELFGLGQKIAPSMDCLGCYKSSCDFVPNCMDLISVDKVEQAVRTQIAAARPGEAAIA